MITEAFLGVLMGIAEFVVAGLPDAETLGLEGFGPAVGLAKSLDAGLPVSEAVIAFGLLLTVASGIFVTKLVLLVWSLVPGKMT